MPGSFPSFSSATNNKQQRRHHRPSQHSPHSDSALNTPVPLPASLQQRRPVSVPPAGTVFCAAPSSADQQQATTGVIELDEEEGHESDTPLTMSTLFGRQQTINEEEGEEEGTGEEGLLAKGGDDVEEDEDITAMVRSEQQPDFGSTITSSAQSDFMLNKRENGAKTGSADEIIMLEDEGANRSSVLALSEENVGDGEQMGNEKQKREEGRGGAEEEGKAEEAAETARRAEHQRRREPIVLDGRTLEAAMRPVSDDENGDALSPLEQYLLGTTLLARLCPLFEMAFSDSQRHQRGPFGKFNLLITEYHVGPDGVLNATFPSYPMSLMFSPPAPSTAHGSPAAGDAQQHSQQQHQCMVRLQLFVCPSQFRLIAKLDYSGSHCPAESDVRVFERFFVREVVPMNNEIAVFAFVTICRFFFPPLFASFAQLMSAQMEPKWPWRADLELSVNIDDLPQQQQSCWPPNTANTAKTQKNVKNAVVVTDLCRKFLFVITLKPREGPKERRQCLTTRVNKRTTPNIAEKRRLILQYIVDSDELTLFKPNELQQLSTEEVLIENVLKTQTELVRQQDPTQQRNNQQRTCCIWPCIRALLEGQHQQQPQRQQQPQQMPPTAIGSQHQSFGR